MSKQEGDYLVFEEDVLLPPEPKSTNKEQTFLTTQGSIEDRLALIRSQISQIKLQKQAKSKYNKANKNVFSHLSHQQQTKRNPVQIQLHTPSQLYDLTKRVQDIESKVGRSEIYNQTVHRKGNLVERVKLLQQKIQKLEKMPTQSIISNISSYHSLVQNKEEQFKYLFLYEQFLKTQGLKDEYCTVKEYLQNLKYIHEQSALLGPSLMKLQSIHKDILSKADLASTAFKNFHTVLQNDYKILNNQLVELQK